MSQDAGSATLGVRNGSPLPFASAFISGGGALQAVLELGGNI